MGIDATVWPANKTTPEPTTNNFYIQDRYSPYRTWELYDKFNNNVRPCLDRAAGDMGKAIQYINFTSGTEGVYPRSLATGYMVDFGGTNKLLSEYMDRIATFNRYGIIPMDFPEYPYKYSLIHQLVYSNSFDRYSTQIHDGCIYAIHPFRAPGRCLDVRANSSDDGAGVIISRPHGGKNQQWRVEPAGDGYYFLHPQNAPEKVLDVLGKKSANLTPTIIYENKSTDNQKWKIEAGKSEYFVLKPKHAPNTALELYEGNIADGVLATLYELNESTAQGWRFVMVGFKAGGIYTIQPRCAAHSNLSVRDGGSVDNSAVVIGPITNAESQKWEITPCGDGYYYLKPLNARDKLLDVKGNKSDNRTPTIIHSNNSQDNQKWKIDSCGNGYFTLRPKSALGKALELYESNSANGTAATLFDVNGSVAQQWNLNGV